MYCGMFLLWYGVRINIIMLGFCEMLYFIFIVIKGIIIFVLIIIFVKLFWYIDNNNSDNYDNYNYYNNILKKKN